MLSNFTVPTDLWFNSCLVFDLETGTSRVGENEIRDNSPFNPQNMLVSIHWKMLTNIKDPATLEADILKPVNTHVVYHEQHPEDQRNQMPQEFLDALAATECYAAHNLKFDANWLRSVGLEAPESGWCTMIGEYIFARGTPVEKSLKATAERRDVTRKKSDLIDAEFKVGKEFYQIDLDKVVEYAEADVQSCAEILVQQLTDLTERKNTGLLPTFKLMNEMLFFLVEIESNGICIDREVLEEVRVEYQNEKIERLRRLEEIVSDVMGDTPINLNSGPDLCAVVYSRALTDKARWKDVMNIGTDARGKSLYPPRMKPTKFTGWVRTLTKVVKQTVAHQCPDCRGFGTIRKTKKDGTPWKNPSPCKKCGKAGALYIPTDKTAGLKLIPEGPMDASVHGFKTDKVTLARLMKQASNKGNEVAVEFLGSMMRLNAINTYLDSFVTGISTWTRSTGFLHAQFNQTITRTGRLSSSQPNFQNQPSGGKFPVRKAVVSRFPNGQIWEADYSGLEFRVAGELSKDGQIIEDILTGKDVHVQTASIINQCDEADVDKDLRKKAKAYTFGPLYGGRGAMEEPHVKRYFDEYFNIYEGLAEWHKTLFKGVLDNGLVTVPSGREYHFPNAERIAGGRVTNATAVVNYPVQGFATGDLVPLSCIRAHKLFKKNKVKSRLILSVHDSIVVDVSPEETGLIKELLKEAMVGVVGEAKQRWNYEFVLPLDIEIAVGSNWMDVVEIALD